MPTFQRTIKAIQYADDGPGALGVGEDAEALTWNNATSHFITNPSGGGGGTSDHAALTHLDYVSSNHTGFAGTGEANTFTRKQTLQSSISDVTLSAENLDNGDFADDLSFWDDVNSSGWAWDAGAALKTPGLSGYLTQNNVGINAGYLYVLNVQITGMTVGSVEVRVLENEIVSVIYLTFTEDGTQSAYATLIGPTVDISVYADEAFDGRVEYVSLKSSSDGYPENIEFKDFTGNFGGAIKAANSKLIIGKTSDPSSQTVDIQGSLTVNQASGNVALKNTTNIFTRKQTFDPAIADLDGSLIPAIDNPDFDTDLSYWTDDSTGWGWDSGAAIHTPGQAGTLSQAISVVPNFLYYFRLEVGGMTAGSVELFDEFTGDILATANGTYETLARVGDSVSNTVYINVSDDFDGRIEAVAFSVVSSDLFPSVIEIRDLANTVSGRFSAAQGGLVIHSNTSIALESGRILFKANSLPGAYDNAYPNQLWSNNGFLFVGDPASIPTSDPGPGGGIWLDGGFVRLS